MKQARPYRSRRIPACSQCRLRRTKCVVESIGSACIRCQNCGFQCSAAVRPRDVHSDHSVYQTGLRLSTAGVARPDDLHIVAPLVARDTQILEELLPENSTARSRKQGPLHPVLVKRRPSLKSCDCSHHLRQQLLRQVGPCLEQIIQLYLDELHPCLPMLDSTSLRTQLVAETSLPIFLLNFEAYVLFYWDLSPNLRHHARPDQDFAWQVACSAMATETQTGGLLSIISAVLNIGGRPSKGVVHNMSNVARIVALANSIGLNHDCSNWNLTETEKRTRTRLWWVVLIHDRWFHFAQGTPPLINTDHYNVPVPDVPLLIENDSSESKISSAQIYIAFCHLTEIVGEILPLVYHVRSGTADSVSDPISRSLDKLNAWFHDQSETLDLQNTATRPSVRGIANLQLSYLAVRMLLRRLARHEQAHHSNGPTPIQHHNEMLLRNSQSTAEDIASFLQSLQPHELAGFWLPYNAQHFSSAMILLLRCALQTTDPANRTACITKARAIVTQLQSYQRDQNWDLAEVALSQSEAVLERIERALLQPGLGLGPPDEGHDSDSEPRHRDGSDLGHTTEQAEEDVVVAGGPGWDSSLEELFPEIFASFFGDYAVTFDPDFSTG